MENNLVMTGPDQYNEVDEKDLPEVEIIELYDNRQAYNDYELDCTGQDLETIESFKRTHHI